MVGRADEGVWQGPAEAAPAPARDRAVANLSPYRAPYGALGKHKEDSDDDRTGEPSQEHATHR